MGFRTKLLVDFAVLELTVNITRDLLRALVGR